MSSTIAFVTKIAAAGASIIRYRDVTDGAEYLYTLLVPADANQLFPCFDQPDLKARVTLRLTAPTSWRVVANSPEASSRISSHGPTEHQFAETEPISTYLIAFAAGPWATVTSPHSKRPITMYVRKSRVMEAEADSIILANDVAARWLEGYFARPFPFKKLDVVLAPAFPFGGMEHPGAIFYNEDRFIFRERPTLPQRLGRTATIYHEVAHQWFGDLVTMRWFDDLWLKEGFSTYMAAKMQASLDSASGAWKTFYLRNKPSAYSVDATRGTTPVWQSLDEPRPGQEQLRRDRLQQGAVDPEAARLSRWSGCVPAGSSALSEHARVRERDVARSARRLSAPRAAVRWTDGASSTSCVPGCR